MFFLLLYIYVIDKEKKSQFRYENCFFISTSFQSSPQMAPRGAIMFLNEHEFLSKILIRLFTLFDIFKINNFQLSSKPCVVYTNFVFVLFKAMLFFIYKFRKHQNWPVIKRFFLFILFYFTNSQHAKFKFLFSYLDLVVLILTVRCRTYY